MAKAKTKTTTSTARIPRKIRNVPDSNYRDPDHDPSDPELSDKDGGDDDNDPDDDDEDDDPDNPDNPDNDPREHLPPAMGPAAGQPTEEDVIVH